ncbi:hypothetical protein ACA910_017591 [Epithemia clementina (nom. ined.)]
MTAAIFPQWLVQTAIATSDSLCATFSWQEKDEHSVAKKQNRRGPSFSRERRPQSIREEDYDDDDDGGDDDDNAFEEEEEGMIVQEPIPFCVRRVWKDFDSSMDNLASDILSFATTTPPIPREITVKNSRTNTGKPAKLRRQHQSHDSPSLQKGARHSPPTFLVPPRPLSRTAPRVVRQSPSPPSSARTSVSSSPALSASHSGSGITSGTSFISSLGSESLANPQEDEDSLLADLEEETSFGQTSPRRLQERTISWHNEDAGLLPTCALPRNADLERSLRSSPIKISPDHSPSDQNTSGSPHSLNRILSPPDIKRRQVPSPPQRPYYPDWFAAPSVTTQDHASEFDDLRLYIGDEETETSLLVMEQQDEAYTAAFGSGESLSPFDECVLSGRDPPEQEGASTTCFTYSTQETTDSFFLKDYIEREEYRFQEEVETTANFSSPQHCADGSSYTTSYNNHDYFILQAATTVKSMLVSPKQQKHHRLLGNQRNRKKLLQRSPTAASSSNLNVRCSHWFLPSSSPSQVSMSRMSTPSHSSLSSPCHSMEEQSV